ncbi:MAG: hypothetical protein CMP51_04365 [Flavobacteriales bacterium]|nr:hypothetical protein [Flavobacteriales bacterium]
MDSKKNPKVDINIWKPIFFPVSLLAAASLILILLNITSVDIKTNRFASNFEEIDEEDIEITRPEEQKPPPPPPKEQPPPELPEEIEVKEDDEELENELDLTSSETDEDDEFEMYEEEFAEPFISVEQMPLLGNCEDEQCTQTEIMKFIARNFRYPEIAKANGVEGKVILEFVVEKNGEVGRVKILKGLDKYVDEAAIEVINKLPEFTPGRQIGKAVPVKYTVPIRCTLG